MKFSKLILSIIRIAQYTIFWDSEKTIGSIVKMVQIEGEALRCVTWVRIMETN